MGFGRMGHLARIEEEKPVDTGAVLRRLGAYLSPYRWRLLGVLVMVLIATGARLASPYIIGLAVDRFIIVGDKAGLARLMLLLLGTHLLGWAANVAQGYQMTVLGQYVLAHMRIQIMQQVQKLSLSFFDRREAGDLMSRLVNDVDVIGQTLNAGVSRMFGDILILVGILVVMFRLSPRLALISYIVVPLMVLSTFFFSRRARIAFRRTREKIGQVSSQLEENISGIRVVQAFNRESANQERFAQVNAANRDANVQAVGITSAFSPTLDILGTLALALVAAYGGYLALQGAVTIGIVVSFLTYVRRFYEPVQSLAQLYTQLQSTLAASERIFELLDTQPELTDAPDAIALPDIQGRVEFDHVSFAYKAEEPVLCDISFVAEPGETVAIVGPTGAGKTTIISLLQRFYDVTAGAIRVDGHDIRQVIAASLRRQIGMVLQDTFLFSGTVMDNIRYGRLEASDDEVIAAARLVNADGFISRLPKGYQTELTERGANLSQGQRQLLAFARAILANPRILILDEATSSVDTRTELLIQAAVSRLLEGRTSFVIAHRLSTIRNADKVLVLVDGRIVERGTHQTLLDQKGVYYDLYMSQFRRQMQQEGQAITVASAAAAAT